MRVEEAVWLVTFKNKFITKAKLILLRSSDIKAEINNHVLFVGLLTDKLIQISEI